MLATLADLAAIGAIATDEPPSSARHTNATRLLEFASAQVVSYLRVADESAVTAAYSATQLTALAAVVAEAAAERIHGSASPSSDYIPTSAMLNRRHYRTIDKILGRAGRGTRAIDAARDDESSFLTYSPTGLRIGTQPNDFATDWI